jgi:hypothetical protein
VGEPEREPVAEPDTLPVPQCVGESVGVALARSEPEPVALAHALRETSADAE